MSTKILARLIIITVFALTFGFLASVVSAESATTFAQPAVGDCMACHWVVRDAWEAGAHGQAGVACEPFIPLFTEELGFRHCWIHSKAVFWSFQFLQERKDFFS